MKYVHYISLYIFNPQYTMLVYIFGTKNAFYMKSKKASLQ